MRGWVEDEERPSPAGPLESSPLPCCLPLPVPPVQESATRDFLHHLCFSLGMYDIASAGARLRICLRKRWLEFIAGISETIQLEVWSERTIHILPFFFFSVLVILYRKYFHAKC